MIGYSILRPVFDRLFNTEIISELYHDVQIWIQEDEKYPIGGPENKYLGVDDTKLSTGYLRSIGDCETVSSEKIGACNLKEYRLRQLYRLVIYRPNETRAKDDLYSVILNSIMVPNVEMRRLITDKTKLLAEEGGSRNFILETKTFYCAVEFFAIVKIQASSCQAEISCGAALPNPICKQEQI